jgi:hypothetical protein
MDEGVNKMDKSSNKIFMRVLLLLILVGVTAYFSWPFYKNDIIRLGCVVADKYCAITDEGYLCDRYRTIKYEALCLPPVQLDEWYGYINANRDLLDARLRYEDVIEMMHQGRFTELEQHFIDIQARYESREINEYAYNILMESLRLYNETMLALYGDWLKQIPDSYVARYGRGAGYYLRGWELRGTKWAKDTPRESMDAYRQYHLLAADDLRAAVALHPKMTIAYRELVSIDNLGVFGRDHWLAESIKYDPYNYLVRRAYIWKLTPRWGGSHHQMHEFASSALQYIDGNPWLRGLAAVEFVDKGRIHNKNERYDQAIANSAIALYHRPDAENYNMHAYTHQQARRYKEAVGYAEEGLKQEPEHIQLLHKYSWSARDSHQYDKADDGFERLIKLKPEYAKYWYSRGALHYTLRKFETSMQFLQKSHELEPSNNLYLYWFALSAINNEAPIALVKMRLFLERCKTNKCTEKNVDWARRWVDCVDGKPNCSMPEHEISIWQKSPLYSS